MCVFVQEKVGERYLVDFLLWVGEECRKVAEGLAVQHNLCLFICAGHNVPNSPQGGSLNMERNENTNTHHSFVDTQIWLL